MVSLVEVKVVCDLCNEEGAQHPADESLIVQFDQDQPHELDLCGEHLEGFAQLRNAARRLGRARKKRGRPTSKEVGSGKYPCPECGEVWDRPQSLGAHRRGKHASEISCPVCGQICVGQIGLMSHQRKHDTETVEQLETAGQPELAAAAQP